MAHLGNGSRAKHRPYVYPSRPRSPMVGCPARQHCHMSRTALAQRFHSTPRPATVDLYRRTSTQPRRRATPHQHRTHRRHRQPGRLLIRSRLQPRLPTPLRPAPETVEKRSRSRLRGVPRPERQDPKSPRSSTNETGEYEQRRCEYGDVMGTQLYPPIEPYETDMLDVGDGNRIYWETLREPGRPRPALALHGGPGSGSVPGMRRPFNPERLPDRPFRPARMWPQHTACQ